MVCPRTREDLVSSVPSGWRAPARSAARIATRAAVTSAMLPAFALRDAMAAAGDRRAVRDLWLRRWAGAMLATFAVAPRVERVSASPEPTSKRIIVANHRSAIDILLVAHLFGGRLVSRADISRWPLVGAAARSVGTIFVDRADARSGAGALRTMASFLQGGDTICIFPEGTTFADDEVRPFHPGAFIAAARAGAAIVPVGIAYPRGSEAAYFRESFAQHLLRVSRAPSCSVAVCIGAAWTPERGSKAAAARDWAHAQVSQLVGQARRIADERAEGELRAPATPPPT
jgi:1-acyl-sn-glycerol-3-phosphate acyltransferase